MTLEAQNEAIAIECGWRRCRNDAEGNYTDDPTGPYWRNPAGHAHRSNKPPNYTGSIDAMLSAFPVLTTPQWDAFLFSVLGNASGAKWASFDQIIYLMKQPPDKLAQHFLRAVGRWQEKGEK